MLLIPFISFIILAPVIFLRGDEPNPKCLVRNEKNPLMGWSWSVFGRQLRKCFGSQRSDIKPSTKCSLLHQSSSQQLVVWIQVHLFRMCQQREETSNLFNLLTCSQWSDRALMDAGAGDVTLDACVSAALSLLSWLQMTHQAGNVVKCNWETKAWNCSQTAAANKRTREIRHCGADEAILLTARNKCYSTSVFSDLNKNLLLEVSLFQNISCCLIEFLSHLNLTAIRRLCLCPQLVSWLCRWCRIHRSWLRCRRGWMGWTAHHQATWRGETSSFVPWRSLPLRREESCSLFSICSGSKAGKMLSRLLVSPSCSRGNVCKVTEVFCVLHILILNMTESQRGWALVTATFRLSHSCMK